MTSKSCGAMLCCASSVKDLFIMFCERNRTYIPCVCSKILHYLLKPSLDVCKGPDFFNLSSICSFYKNELVCISILHIACLLIKYFKVRNQI